ncbi:polyphenol oxidase family protein [Propioniciclava soli]|uniref:Polyphenol oxidase family protein n=1 Tax=Propioniciclava soli TaxID=2775081 RepID=A0ABZ3C4L1_9ACTN
MFHHHSDPGADGVGVAFTSAELDLGDRQTGAARADAFARLSQSLGVPVAIVGQVHGAAVADADQAPLVASGLVDLGVEADAVLTSRRGLAVAVRVADCVPILLAAADGGAVAAVHAGRAGLLAGVIGAAVARLRERSAAPLRAWIGPHICGACYEVPPELAADAAARLGVPVPRTRWGTTGIDLGAAAARQLAEAGAAVTVVPGCTLTTPTLHSHRRDPGGGRQVGLIWRG